jgi:hypothetical protein
MPLEDDIQRLPDATRGMIEAFIAHQRQQQPQITSPPPITPFMGFSPAAATPSPGAQPPQDRLSAATILSASSPLRLPSPTVGSGEAQSVGWVANQTRNRTALQSINEARLRSSATSVASRGPDSLAHNRRARGSSVFPPALPIASTSTSSVAVAPKPPITIYGILFPHYVSKARIPFLKFH